MIVTEKAVFAVTEQGLLLKETAPGVTLAELKSCTEADYAVSRDLQTMRI
jgi:acyl CoA:acetate/3-ketoacid CoA transferase beta subunit